MAEAAASAFLQECWGLQGTAYLVLAARYYQQFSTNGFRTFAGDDVLMLMATLVYTAESVAAHFVVAYWKGFANNGMTDEQRETLDPDDPEYALRVNGSKTHVIGLLLYATLLWLLKGCWIFYYNRLAQGVDRARWLIVWGRWIIPVTYVACLLVAFLKCIPFEKQWQIYPDPGNSCTPAVSYLQTIFVMVMNTITDIYLMAIPLPMIWKAQMPWKKKVTLMVMFSGGLLELVFGILRCVSVLTVGNKDPAQSGYWSIRESFVSYILTNMPMVYPMLKRFIDKSRNASTRRTGTQESHGYRLESQNRADRSKTGMTSSTAPANRNEPWDSKERIVVGSDDGYPSSLPESDSNIAQIPGDGAMSTGSGGASSGETHTRRSSVGWEQGKGRSERNEQIVVTTEYTVQVDQHRGQQTGAVGQARAW
jgi:hypothetical protein